MVRKRLLFFEVIALLLLVACGSAATIKETPPPPLDKATSSIDLLATETSISTQASFQMPEGRLLVYVDLGEDGGEYQLIDLLTLEAQPYAPLNSEDWFFDWSYVLSPDARYLAYERSINKDYSNHTLYLLDLNTGESTRITDYSQSNGIPNWTADGRYMEFDKYNQGLFIYDTQASSLRQISTSSGFADASAISPAGDRIAYTGGCPGEGIPCPADLYMINADGSGEQYLDQGYISWIFWSRDGNRIYYSLFGDRETYGNSGDPANSGYRLHYFDLQARLSTSIEDWKFNSSATDSSFLSPNGEYLVYVFGNAGMKLITTTDYSMIDFLPGGYVAWSPDSRYLVTSSYEGEWNLLDIETGETTKLEVNLPVGSQVVGWLP